MKCTVTLVCLLALGGNSPASAQEQTAPKAETTLPALPSTPSQATRPTVIHVQEVTLADSYETDFRKERPTVSSGWLIVLRARADVLAPRALAQPLLLAQGEGWTESVEWFNHGFDSGLRVAFVPRTSAAARAKDALAKCRIWFGAPGLPEQLDAQRLAQESALADAAGIPMQRISTTAAALGLRDRAALVGVAHALVARHAPTEAVPEPAATGAPAASK